MHGGVVQERSDQRLSVSGEGLFPHVLRLATVEELRCIPPSVLRNFSDEQIQAISCIHLPHLHREQVVELLTYRAAAFKLEQIIHLIPHYLIHVPLREWLELSPEVIAKIPIEHFVRIPPRFLLALHQGQLWAITEEQIAALTLPQVYEGILPCYLSLTLEQKSCFLRRHLHRLSAELIRKLPKSIICDIATKDMSKLVPHLFSQFSQAQLAHMSPDKIGSMAIEQVFEILFYRANDWTRDQIAAIPEDIIAEIPAEHMMHLRAEVFCALSAKQLNRLNMRQIKALQKKHFIALSEEQLKKLEAPFIGYIPVKSIAYFSRSQQIHLLKYGKVAYFLEAQIHALESDIADSIWSLRAASRRGITSFKEYLPLDCAFFEEAPIITEEQEVLARDEDLAHYVSA